MALFLKDFTSWWLGAAVIMLSGLRGQRYFSTKSRLAVVSREYTSLFAPDCEQPQQFRTVDDLRSHLADRLGKARSKSPKVTLRLAQDQAIIRKISDMALPRSRHRAVAQLDLEAATPFRPGDVYLLVLEQERAVRGSAYAIVKRAILDPYLEAVSQVGLKIAGFEIDSGDGVHAVARSDRDRLTGASRARKNLFLALAVATIVLPVAGTWVHVSIRYDRAIETVEADIERLSGEAKQVRAELDARAARIAQIQSLNQSLSERRPVTAIWEELARIIPDSAFLTDLNIKHGSISVAGYAGAAPSLIAVLEGSPFFSEASFSTPVVKVPGSEGDRFNIELKTGLD